MNQKILIVGQDSQNCQRIKRKLQEAYENIKVYCVISYTKALNDISRYPYTLIIADLDSSEIGGAPFVCKICGLSEALLLIISAHAVAEEVNILDAGADQYLSVGSTGDELEMDRLLANVQALLNSRTKRDFSSYTVLSSIGLKLGKQRWQAYANGESLH